MRAIKITESKKDAARIYTYFYYKKTWYCIEEIYDGCLGYSDELLIGIPVDVIRRDILKVDNITIFKENEIIPNEYIKLIAE